MVTWIDESWRRLSMSKLGWTTNYKQLSTMENVSQITALLSPGFFWTLSTVFDTVSHRFLSLRLKHCLGISAVKWSHHTSWTKGYTSPLKTSFNSSSWFSFGTSFIYFNHHHLLYFLQAQTFFSWILMTCISTYHCMLSPLFAYVIGGIGFQTFLPEKNRDCC